MTIWRYQLAVSVLSGGMEQLQQCIYCRSALAQDFEVDDEMRRHYYRTYGMPSLRCLGTCKCVLDAGGGQGLWKAMRGADLVLS
jgi:hypothetical protein